LVGRDSQGVKEAVVLEGAVAADDAELTGTHPADVKAENGAASACPEDGHAPWRPAVRVWHADVDQPARFRAAGDHPVVGGRHGRPHVQQLSSRDRGAGTAEDDACH
jgi:hypothetical protein